MAKELTKTEVQNIVKDEIKKFVTKELDNEVSSLLSKINSKTRKIDNENTKDALEAFAKFMWIRKDVWKNDIK